MNLFDDERIPTPEECIQEFTYQSQLQKLEQECAQRKASIEVLRDIEQSLRKSIVQLSHTLGQLYELNASLVSGCTPRIDTSAEH